MTAYVAGPQELGWSGEALVMQNLPYDMTSPNKLMLLWTKHYGNKPNAGDSLTREQIAHDAIVVDTGGIEAPARVLDRCPDNCQQPHNHVMDAREQNRDFFLAQTFTQYSKCLVEMGFLSEDNNTYSITDLGVAFLAAGNYDDYIRDELGDDIQNLHMKTTATNVDGSQTTPRGRFPDLTERQTEMVVWQLLSIGYGTEFKCWILGFMRFFRISPIMWPEWTPRPGNVNREDWSGERLGLFRIIFAKGGDRKSSANNAITQGRQVCLTLGLFRNDTEMTSLGRRVYLELERQHAMPHGIPSFRVQL